MMNGKGILMTLPVARPAWKSSRLTSRPMLLNTRQALAGLCLLPTTTRTPGSGQKWRGWAKAASLMAVLTFTLPNSQSLIYTGQEVGYDHRLAFFEKDPVPSWYPNMYTGFYRQMTRLRHSHSALRDGSYEMLEDQWVPDDVFAFTMTDSREQVLVLANFSQAYRSCTLPDGVKWADAFTGDYFDDEMNCPVVEPWGWRILVRK